MALSEGVVRDADLVGERDDSERAAKLFGLVIQDAVHRGTAATRSSSSAVRYAHIPPV